MKELFFLVVWLIVLNVCVHQLLGITERFHGKKQKRREATWITAFGLIAIILSGVSWFDIPVLRDFGVGWLIFGYLACVLQPIVFRHLGKRKHGNRRINMQSSIYGRYDSSTGQGTPLTREEIRNL